MALAPNAAVLQQDMGPLDWSCPDEAVSEISKTTLDSLQQQWKAHAASMDAHGRQFAEAMFKLHAGALQELAATRSLDVKQVTDTLNSFTSCARQHLLQTFQVMRQADDVFAQGLYDTSRKAVTRHLREAMEAKDAACADKVKRMAFQHQQALATQRAAATVERNQELALLRVDITRQVQEENRHKLAQAIQGITTELTQHYNRILETKASSSNEDNNSATGYPSVLSGNNATGSASQAITGQAAGAVSLPEAPLPSAVLDIINDLTANKEDHAMPYMARKELDNSLQTANVTIEELRAKVTELQADRDAWHEKWSQESTKTDGIKKECLQVITKCERKVKSLQEDHYAELSKRDGILQRCKDAIMRLEARVAELSGQAGVEAST